ncbi:MAG: hypothetical protein AAF065_09220 [Verrucomicrobiota bacterium]
MGFIKKNLVFCVFVLICVLVFGVGVFFAMSEAGKVKKSQRTFETSKNQLNSLLYANPAPTTANVEAAEQNVAKLIAALGAIRENLQRGSGLTTSSDGVSVMAGLQQFIFEHQKIVEAHENSEGIPAPILIPEEFGFGFEQYVDQTPPIEDSAKIAILDKQRQIVTYLVTQLIQSDPRSIDAIQREILEIEGESGFMIDDVVSARVPGAIDTMAYSLSFSGYTSSLRSFLNSLSKFDLPIVVRSISVERPSGSETVVSPGSGNNLDELFGIFGNDDSVESEMPQETQMPVIEENISNFTVVVEFIEVVLPDASNEELSDPA